MSEIYNKDDRVRELFIGEAILRSFTKEWWAALAASLIKLWRTSIYGDYGVGTLDQDINVKLEINKLMKAKK